jgi:hypothetical protein
VQVLEEHDERLDLALAQQQRTDPIEGPSAPLLGLKVLPGRSSACTSSNERIAGTTGMSDWSSVRTLPLTFSRILRASSRGSIWK